MENRLEIELSVLMFSGQRMPVDLPPQGGKVSRDITTTA